MNFYSRYTVNMVNMVNTRLIGKDVGEQYKSKKGLQQDGWFDNLRVGRAKRNLETTVVKSREVESGKVDNL